MSILSKSLLPILVTASTVLAQSPLYTGVNPPGSTTWGQNLYPGGTVTPYTHTFDITVTDPLGITFTEIDVRLNNSGTVPATVSFYVTPVGVSATGNYNNAAVWTQVASETLTAQNAVIAVPLSTPFFLLPGSYGMAIHYDGVVPYYFNPGTTGITTYPCNELTVDCTSARIRNTISTDPFTTTTGGGWTPRHPETIMHFVTGPASVNFDATPREGPTPLQVQFSDYSFSGNPGGIIAWAWDFGDGTTSTLQNPTHTYTVCGDYTVTLTAFDVTGGFTETKTNFILTDYMTPNFSAQLIGPNQVQFTDLTTPTPATWDWDFDGDGIVDSNLQNPTYTFLSPCAANDVSLTVNLACRTASVARPIAAAEQIHLTYQGGLWINATVLEGSNFIDVDVTNPDGITICGMNVRSGLAAGLPLTVNIWQKAGTYVGAERTPDVWRNVATEAVTTNTNGAITFVAFSSPIYLAAGTHGLAIQQLGASPIYTNMGGTQVFANADLTITAGATMAEPLFDAAATLYSPRIFNGGIFYKTSTMTGAPGYGFIGEGCPGTLGVPGNTAASQPVIGTTMNIEFDKVQNNTVLFIIGFSRTTSPFGPLPVDMGPFGAPGCFARVNPFGSAFLVGAGNVVTYPFVVPPTTQIVGLQFYTQAFSLEVGFNPLGGVMSDAAACILGM